MLLSPLGGVVVGRALLSARSRRPKPAATAYGPTPITGRRQGQNSRARPSPRIGGKVGERGVLDRRLRRERACVRGPTRGENLNAAGKERQSTGRPAGAG